MNVITKSDIKKFLYLLKAGLREGKQKELKTYTSATCVDGTDVPKEYYISLEMNFRINPEAVDRLMAENYFDEELQDLFKSINGN